ncbi:MCE family protein [Parashewanella spongiae]|uniref:MCE family protein n=1 Tax=Parashewanella spongiae TaxID=342950 RepID=A0A3A6TQD5_9GAMM|nr:MlaD family protein [Parashewanella spongiae]MCL1078477.1 MlaD family protein [Parashewanella spongiae]RJY14661.1 MCE family protein [Parashewanella spongiae]
MIQTETPKIVKKKLFSPVWLLPVVAIILGIWLIIRGIHDAGIEIEIHFPNATGIEIGKTLVKYQGVTVGKVTDIAIEPDLRGVEVTVNMNYRGISFLNENTQFWLVSPKASITKIEGLDTLFSGNYIAIKPGDGNMALRFEASLEAPAQMPASEGMLVTLFADKLSSLDIGSHVFYRQIPVGNVVSYRLNQDDKVAISVFIQKQYANLIKKGTHFWNSSGVQIDASLSGISVKSESLASLIAGGISFNSPKDSESAKSGDIYKLYDSEENALGGKEFTITTSNAESVNKGTPIKYRGVNIGEIVSKRLINLGRVELSARIYQHYAHLLTGSAKFWVEGADISLSGIKNPERLISGSVISFLPGQGAAKSEYPILSETPDAAKQKNVKINITSDQNYGLSIGAEIKYKDITIGKISALALNGSFTQVDFTAEIRPEFKPLLTNNSYFVPKSAFALEASLDKVSVKTTGISSAITGAIVLMKHHGKTTNSTAQFALYESLDNAMSIFEQSNTTLIGLSNKNAADLQKGSLVYYKKMQIGKIQSVNWQAQTDSFDIKVGIQKEFTSLLSNKTVFWRNSAAKINASLSGIEVDVAPLQGALKGSISLGLIETSQYNKPNTQLYDSKNLALNQAQPITIVFPASVKLKAKAEIRYQGFQVGKVQAVSLNKDLKSVTVIAYLYGEYARYFNKTDSQFVIIDADISLAGITAPETIITGPYINAIPSLGSGTKINTTTPTSNFVGKLANETYANLPKGAVKILLIKPELGSINMGTRIFFRGIAIGQVDGYKLSANGNDVMVLAHITKKYAPLVNSTSKFWKRSGIKVDAGLFSGVQVDTGSLENILVGGIAVATEHSTDSTNALTDSSSFMLHDEAKQDWIKWKFK